MLREIKEDVYNCKIYDIDGFKNSIIEVSVFLHWSVGSIHSTQNPATFLYKWMILKFIQKCKIPRIAKIVLKKKNKIGEYARLKTSYKVAVINIVWY